MEWEGWLRWRRKRKKEQQLQAMAIGVNSSVDLTQDLHIVMLDFDMIGREKVVESVREVQEFWKLSDVTLYRTRHGYHAIAWFDHVPYERVRQIIDFTRYVDPMFKYIGRYYDHKTLRAAGKHEERDIVIDSVLPGVRVPTPEEVERGSMKRKEHEALLKSDRISL